MHKVLERQLKKIFGSPDKVPSGLDELLSAVSRTYQEFDDDKSMVDRSLEISSNELRSLLELSENKKRELTEKTNQLEKMNQFLVERENRMIELKAKLNKAP
jgi:hypothetical protein